MQIYGKASLTRLVLLASLSSARISVDFNACQPRFELEMAWKIIHSR